MHVEGPRRLTRVLRWVNPLAWFWRHYYGYEFFVSHAQVDARRYAAALHEELTRAHHYRCFLDRTEIEAGEGLTPAIERALQRTDVLIVLRSAGAEQSRWVAREVQHFRGTRRRIIVIDLRGEVARTPEANPSDLGRALGELLFIGEDPATLAKGPSEDALRTVCRSFAGVRIATRRLWIVSMAAVLLLFATALSIWFGLNERSAKEAARREAVAARRETANRLAVQAIERLKGAPEESLVLAMEAVKTFRNHGDPLVPDALAALEQGFLALSRGRWIAPWGHAPDNLIVSDDLRSIVFLQPDGGVRIGRAGAARHEGLRFPAEGLAPFRTWSPERAHAVFSARGSFLVTVRGWQGTHDEVGARIVAWPLQPDDRPAEPWVVGDTIVRYFDAVRVAVSPDGRWVAWTDGKDRAWLRDTEARSDLVALRPSMGIDAPVPRFSPDSRQLFIVEQFRIQRWRLDPGESAGGGRPTGTGARGAGSASAIATEERPLLSTSFDASEAGFRARWGEGPALPELESFLDIVDLAFSPAGNRVAALTVQGEVAWWDLSSAESPAHPLTNVFTAYADYLKVHRLERADVDARVRLSPEGDKLLVTCRERKHSEFGIAAVADLNGGGPWRTLLQRHTGKAEEQVSRTSGSFDGQGVTQRSGYEVVDVGQLGVKAATFLIGGEGVATLGFDGTLFLWDLSRPRPLHLTSGAAAIATWSDGGLGAWLAVGGLDGRVRLWNMKDFDGESFAPQFEFNGHDAPVRELRLSQDERRVVSMDELGLGRAWDLDHPSVREKLEGGVSADARWLVTTGEDGRFAVWDLESNPTLEHAAEIDAFTDVRWMQFDRESPWAVTLHRGTNALDHAFLRLWDLTQNPAWNRPVAEYRFEAPGATPDPLQDGGISVLGFARRGKDAWVLFQGVSQATPRMGIINLLDPTPRTIDLGSLATFRTPPHASPDLRWLVLQTSGSPGDGPAAYHLRRLEPPFSNAVDVRLPVGSNAAYYGTEFGPDGRWFVRRTEAGASEFFSLEKSQSTQALEPEATLKEVAQVALGFGRDPIWLDRKGDLWGWHRDSGSPARRVPLLLGQALSAVAWDDAGEWLGLGDDQGRVYVVPVRNHAGLEEIQDRLQRRQEPPLPSPTRPLSRLSVETLALFPRQGWVGAADGGRHVFLWPRSRDGGDWDVPLVLNSEVVLREDLNHIAFSAGGRRVHFWNTESARVLTLDPDDLYRAAESLLSGRIRTLRDLGDTPPSGGTAR